MNPQQQKNLDEILAAPRMPVFSEWLGEISPEMHWDWPHLRFIQNQIERVTKGEIKRLMLFVPPRHGKSQMVTVRYSAWRIERDHKTRVILGCYNQDLARLFSRQIRKLTRTRSKVVFAKDRNTAVEWETEKGGGLLAAGVGTGVTGRGGDLIVIDDPIKGREEAQSSAFKRKVWDWYTNDLYTRLEPGAAMILIMTRWAEDDLAGRILSSEDGPSWTVVNLPALAEEADPLGRRPGAALCPARFDEAALANLKSVLRVDFDALYQGRPVAREGGDFKRAWFEDARIPANELPNNLRWYRYYDLAYSMRESADNTATLSGALGGDGVVYLRRGRAGRMESPDIRAMITQICKGEADSMHGVEEALHGGAIVQDLMRDRSLVNISIRSVKVTKDKRVRAAPVIDRAAAGKLKFVVETASDEAWIQDWIDEMCMFPHGAHDDRVDTVSGLFQMLAIPVGLPVILAPRVPAFAPSANNPLNAPMRGQIGRLGGNTPPRRIGQK